MIGSSRFWRRTLGAATAASVRRPRGVVAAALAIAALGAGLAVSRLELHTSNLDLIDPHLPTVARFRAFAATFGTPNFLVVVLEGEDPAALVQAADRVAAVVVGRPDVRRVLSRLPFREDLLLAFGMEPRFRSRDGRELYLFVQPDDPESAASTIGPFVDGVRSALEGLGLERAGVRVGFTGLPQYALDDRDVIQRDVSRLSGFAFVGVLIVFAVGFRGLREPLLAMATLAWAAAATAGVAAIVPGHLTLVSAFFFAILFGLGIDFGIHLVERAEDLRAEGRPVAESLVEGVRRLAPGLGTGAATTIASFLLLLASGFRGFAELGWLAGVGVALALLGMVTLLPALIVLWPGRERGRRAGARRTARTLLSAQRPTVALGLTAIALSLPGVGLPRFDGDYLDLQPRGSEAVRLERRMVEGSDFAAQFAVFVTRDGAAAEGLAARLRAEPTVGAVRSLADFAPLLALEAEIAEEWPAFRSFYQAEDGRQAVYAFPAGDVWDAGFQEAFLSRMRALDPEVTGMPVLGRFLVERSRRALAVTGTLAALFLLALVALDLGNPWRTGLAVLPAFGGVALMLVGMRLLDTPFNPLNVLALPIVLGVAEDGGVHLVHRFVAERGDLVRTLGGAGRTVLLCGVTTLLGFGALTLAAHRGLASFALALTLGVGGALAVSLLVLPQALLLARPRLLSAEEGA